MFTFGHETKLNQNSKPEQFVSKFTPFSCYLLLFVTVLNGDMVVKTNAILTVARTRVEYVLIYSKIENAVLSSLSWAQVANISKGTLFCSYVLTA